MSRRIVTRRKGGFSDAILLPLETLDDLRDVPATDIVNHSLVLVGDPGTLFRYDPTSILADDDATVIAPSVGSGRWIMTASTGAGTVDYWRRLWWQDQEIPLGQTVTLEAGTELLINELDVQGTLDVMGTLIFIEDTTDDWRKKWSQPTTIPAGYSDVLPSGSQLIIYDTLTIDGTFDVQGDLYFLP